MQIAVFTVSTDLTVETLPGRLREYGAEGIEWRVAAAHIAAPSSTARSQWYWINNHATLNLHQIRKKPPGPRSSAIKQGSLWVPSHTLPQIGSGR